MHDLMSSIISIGVDLEVSYRIIGGQLHHWLNGCL